MTDMTVYVLLRSSKKTGKVDMCMTAITGGMLKLWAMQNTTKTKRTLIFDRGTGDCVMHVEGNADGMPIINKYTGEKVTCADFGLRLEDLQAITDDRFDK